MDFIVESDLGHDPDDFFTLCHLVSAGGRLRCLCLTPGAPEQVAVAHLLRQVTEQDFTIGVAKPNPKPEHVGVHAAVLKKRGLPSTAAPDGPGEELIRQAHARHPEADFFLIGPAPSLGRYLRSGDSPIGRLTMQGGFLPYERHCVPCVRLPKFEGCDWVPSFNLNGDRKAVEAICAAKVGTRRFVGKNVCHTILFDRARLEQLAQPRDPASELYVEAMRLYLDKHEEKKFHDPTALVCHLHADEVGVWVRGRVAKKEQGWTTDIDPEGDHVLADVDRERLWQHLLNWT